MGVPRINYAKLKTAIAAHMYDNIVHGTSLFMSPSELSERLEITVNVARLCTRLLVDEKLVYEGQKRQEIRGAYGAALSGKPEFEMVGTGSYTLTEKGREFVEAMEDSAYDAIIAAAASEDSDAEWEPLELERPDAEAGKAADSIDALIEVISSDNGYAANEPAEREEVILRLRQASDWIRNAEYLTASAFQAYVVWPLETLASRFSVGTAIGSAAKFAVGVVTAWLKSRGLKVLDGMFE